MNNYLTNLTYFHYSDDEEKKIFFDKLKTYLGEGIMPDFYELLYGPRLFGGPYEEEPVIRDGDSTPKSERMRIALMNLKNSLTEVAEQHILTLSDDDLGSFLKKLAEYRGIGAVTNTNELAKIIHEALGLDKKLQIDFREELLTTSLNIEDLLGKSNQSMFDGDPYGSSSWEEPVQSPSAPIGETLFLPQGQNR